MTPFQGFEFYGKAKGLWVRNFVISCFSLGRKILNFFRRLVKSVNLTASRLCNGLWQMDDE